MVTVPVVDTSVELMHFCRFMMWNTYALLAWKYGLSFLEFEHMNGLLINPLRYTRSLFNLEIVLISSMHTSGC